MYQNKNLFINLFFTLFIGLLLILTGCNKRIESKNNSLIAMGISKSQTSFEKRSNKPNIILILADDVGYEIPGYTGGQSYSTPNLDVMAANGTQFTQVHGASICSPS